MTLNSSAPFRMMAHYLQVVDLETATAMALSRNHQPCPSQAILQFLLHFNNFNFVVVQPSSTRHHILSHWQRDGLRMNEGQVVILQRYHFIPNNFNNDQLHSHPQPQQLTFTPARLGTSVSLARASFALTFFVAYQLRVESHEISNSLNECSPGSSGYSSTNSQNH